jgi:hypothetical protein
MCPAPSIFAASSSSKGTAFIAPTYIKNTGGERVAICSRLIPKSELDMFRVPTTDISGSILA